MKKTNNCFIAMLCLILAVCYGCADEHIHIWDNGVCSLCGEYCAHSFDENVVCTECGIELDDVYTVMPAQSENGNIHGVLYTPSVYRGKLPTVIISHGFGANASMTMARKLARRGYAAYAFDFCGGSPSTLSDMAFEDMSIDTERADLKAVFELVSGLPMVDSERIYLYGESQGGLVTAITAVDIKERIAGIILMYSGFSIVSAMATEYPSLDSVGERVEVHGKSLKRGYAEAIFKFLPEGYEQITDEGTSFDVMRKRLAVTKTLYEYVAGYDGRVIIFHGTKDNVVDIAFSREAVKYYKNVKLTELAGERHGFGIEAYDKTVADIDSFMKGRI